MPNHEHHSRIVSSTLIILALLGFVFLLYQMYPVILLAFAAVLIALIFNMVATYFTENTRLNYYVSLAVSILLIFSSIGLISYLFGQQLSDQISAMVARLPSAWEVFRTRIEIAYPEINLEQELAALIPTGDSIVGVLRGTLSSVTGALSGFILALFGGVYLAARPGLYFNGFLILIPKSVRPRIEDALLRSAHALRLWLGGQVLSMIGVGLLSGLGLWLLGVPSYLALGLISGLLNFVPLIGPVLAAVPAFLLGLTIDTQTALLVILLYLIVQQIEGALFQPYIQARAVNIPAAVTLFSLFAIGGLFGFGGVLIAAPLTVLIFTLVKTLYVRDTLQEDIDLPSR